nr:profilin-4 isoform X1 [Crassostrea gigas]
MQSCNIRASSAGPNVKTCIQGYVRAKLCGLQYIRASSLGFNVGTCIQGCNVRASSVGFKLHHDQVQMMLDAFKNPPQTREEGIYFDDQQYKCVRADKNSIYGKCDKRGLILVKTQSMLIVATYTENMFPSVCVEAVEKLADYFKEKGK